MAISKLNEVKLQVNIKVDEDWDAKCANDCKKSIDVDIEFSVLTRFTELLIMKEIYALSLIAMIILVVSISNVNVSYSHYIKPSH